MRRWLALWISVLMLALSAGTQEPDPADALLGDWTTEKEESIFVFYKEGGLYHARVDWMRQPVYPAGDPEAGKPMRDRENPEESMHKVPLQDYVFLKNFRFKEKKWVGGTIYDPTEGDTYKCQLHIDDGELKVRGYIGVPLLGRTVTWKRPSPELKKLAAETPPQRPVIIP